MMLLVPTSRMMLRDASVAAQRYFPLGETARSMTANDTWLSNPPVTATIRVMYEIRNRGGVSKHKTKLAFANRCSTSSMTSHSSIDVPVQKHDTTIEMHNNLNLTLKLNTSSLTSIQ